MRNPDRIQPLLNDIANIWEQVAPDMRFMQFIVNFQTWRGTDCFYLEDEDLIEQLCEFAKTLLRG